MLSGVTMSSPTGSPAEERTHPPHLLHFHRPQPMPIVRMRWTRWRSTACAVQAPCIQPCLEGHWQRCPVDLAVALHLGALRSL